MPKRSEKREWEKKGREKYYLLKSCLYNNNSILIEQSKREGEKKRVLEKSDRERATLKKAK